MPSYTDDELWLIAPNIQVQVGSPSQPPPGELPSLAFPANIFTSLSIYSRRTEPIGKDRTNDLIALTKPKPPTHFLLKNYADPVAKPTPSPPPPPPPLPPPPSLLPPSTPPFTAQTASPTPTPSPPPSSKSSLPDLPPGLPFDEIKYVPKDLVGVIPPPLGKVSASRGIAQIRWDPLIKSTYASFKDFPSAVYINAINSCISTPYFSPQDKRHRNGVLNDSGMTDETGTTYLWNMDDKKEKNDVLDGSRGDGIVNVKPQPCDAKSPRKFIYLIPDMKEQSAGIKNGDSLNAFSLIFGIMKGTNSNMAQAGAWSIKLSFGDVLFEMFEGKEEGHVSIQGTNPAQKITIKPTVGNVLTTDFGGRVFILTFIPVWNGLLVSYGVPGSSKWGDSVSFIPIDQNLDINTEINHITNPPPKNDYDIPDPNYIPKTVVKRNNKRYKTPGVRIVNSKTATTSLSRSNTGNGKPSTFKMGKEIRVMYYHCGGALKFVPIYFPQYSRYHFIYPGAASNSDLTAATEYVPVAPPGSPPPPPPSKKKKPKPKIKPKTINQNVFLVPTKSKAITMPIFGFQSGSFVDFRTHICTIVKDKQAPFACFSMEFKSLTPDVRVPIQVWGGIIVDNVIADDGFAEQAPANQDGTISSAAVSIPRIRSVSVQRGMDGATGSIEWDRFDPLTQTVDPRPYQEVGAIQIQATGGANTIPGIIFTGIAYGNAEEDQPGENLVRIPIKGRESKISSEGGLGLINTPFFDGHDHREAMNYMAVYGGFPIDTSLAAPFKLISSYNINNPVVDFPMGTPVSNAMDTICQYAGSVYYFNRFGICIYMDVQKSTGVNWNYPDLALESFSDEPDSTWVRNQIWITALVASPQIGKPLSTNVGTTSTQAVVLTVDLDTYPKFAWSKMAVYAIPQVVKDVNELQRLAVQISKGQSRPRSSARCKIPGNAQIELHDTINGKWLITSISHQIDLQRKTWSTDIGVELFIPDVEPTVSSPLAPVVVFE
jgi:hypothetical protein